MRQKVWYIVPMEQSTKEVLKWLAETMDIYDIRLGPYEAMFDEAAQFYEWHCYGCEGLGWSRWPKWELSFEHKPGCMYERFRQLLEEAKAE